MHFLFLFSIYADLVEQSSGFGSFGSSSSKDQKKSKYFNDYKSDHRHDRDRDEVSAFGALKHTAHKKSSIQTVLQRLFDGMWLIDSIYRM